MIKSRLSTQPRSRHSHMAGEDLFMIIVYKMQHAMSKLAGYGLLSKYQHRIHRVKITCICKYRVYTCTLRYATFDVFSWLASFSSRSSIFLPQNSSRYRVFPLLQQKFNASREGVFGTTPAFVPLSPVKRQVLKQLQQRRLKIFYIKTASKIVFVECFRKQL